MIPGSAYADGYQSALHDIEVALRKDGEAGVRTWLANNLNPGQAELAKASAARSVALRESATAALKARMADRRTNRVARRDERRDQHEI